MKNIICDNCIHKGLCDKEFNTSQQLRYNKNYKCLDFKDSSRLFEIPLDCQVRKVDTNIYLLTYDNYKISVSSISKIYNAIKNKLPDNITLFCISNLCNLEKCNTEQLKCIRDTINQILKER